MHIGIRIAVVTTSMAFLVGCSARAGDPTSTVDPFFTQLLGEARNGGASAAQIAVLEEAAAAGKITYAQAEVQLAEYFACLEQSGLDPRREPDREDPPGYRIPDYTIGLGDEDADLDAALALVDVCYTEHYDFVDTAYQLQPAAIEAENADIESQRAEILECIAEHDGDADPDSTTDELVNAIIEVGDRTGVWCYEFS